MKKGIAELIGTFILVFIGTGAVVLSGKIIGMLGIAIAFGLTIVAAAYSIGVVSGAHLNPAVSIAMFVNGRLAIKELVTYVVAQVIGAFLGTATLSYLLQSSGKATANLGQNLFNNVNAGGAFIVETLLTFIFVLVIVTVTSKKFGQSSLAGMVIGFTLTMIHFVGVPLTGMSANPARSLAPAVFIGKDALSEVWVFIFAPIVGGILAALVGKFLLATEED
ncbi:MAG: aquaporin [Lactobacillales bacterium]|jgi:aquaporin Z|nr:aquaporin [Lactobacillales bacterium]